MSQHRPHRVAPKLLAFAREMRHQSAPAENILWQCLRGRQLNGFKFRRQHAIGGYILDFFCAECGLVIELDGDSHSDRVTHDEVRTQILEGRGLKVIRFENPEVFDHLDGVLERILEECERASPVSAAGPSPSLSPEYRGEEKDGRT
jgi:very-short-patch-repair endonuclease